jgi:predicted phage tail protein
MNKSSALVIQLLTQCQLIERILDAFNQNVSTNDENSVPLKQYRPGYMGHIVNIANSIVEKCEQHFLQQHLTEELFEKWNDFVKVTLTEINKQINTPLVNEMPNSATLDEEALRQQESALQQVRTYTLQSLGLYLN